MPSITAAVKAAALHRARSAAAKSIVRGGPLLQRGMVGRPLQQRDWYTEQAVERYFKLSGLVYRSAVSLATAVGSVRWQVEARTTGQWERMDEDHELQRLLDQPHPYFNRQAWNEMLVLYLVLVGNGLNLKTIASGKLLQGAKFGRVLEMVPLVPDGINPVPDDVEWISRWEFKGPPVKRWEPSEMLHVMLPDPGNPYWGMSPFQSVRKIIRTDLAAIDWNQSSMNNRAVSDGVFSVSSALTTAQYNELKDQVWLQHQGGANAHEPWIIGGDGKWLPMERTPVEMDFNATRMRLREDVLSSAGIPPVVAGYFENATLANADVSRRLFWEDSAIPNYVERIGGAINGGIVPHFGDPRRLRVTYDISGIPALRDDLVKKAAALRVLVQSGVPYNDALEELELDLPKIEGLGDVPYGLETMRPSVGVPLDQGADPAGDLTAAKGRRPARHQHGKAATKPEARKLGAGVRTGAKAATLPAPTAIADAEASNISRAFLSTIEKLRSASSAEKLAALLRGGGDPGTIIQQLGGTSLTTELNRSLGAALERAVSRGADIAGQQLAEDFGRQLSLDTGRVRQWLHSYGAERVNQITVSTETATRSLVADFSAGKLGTDAEAVASLLRESWGIHSQQAAALRNQYSALLADGKTPAEALNIATTEARAMLNKRAVNIASHESLVAANRGNGMLWEQAVADGAISAAYATWVTAGDGDVDGICVQLSGQEINIAAGERFAAGGWTYREPPEPHPYCRCVLLYSGVP